MDNLFYYMKKFQWNFFQFFKIKNRGINEGINEEINERINEEIKYKKFHWNL